MTRARTPVRTCVGCRARAAKSTLVRIVSRSDGLAIDGSGAAPGRGAYLHAAPACVEAAARSRALGRALRSGLDAEELTNELGRLKLEIERIGAV